MGGGWAGWVGSRNELRWLPASRSAQAKQAASGRGEQGSAQRRDPPRGRGKGREPRRAHAQRDPSVLCAEGGVRGRDTRATRLLIGRRGAERGGAGAVRALRRAAWRVCNGR